MLIALLLMYSKLDEGMSQSDPKELTQANQYIIKGRYKDSLRLLDDFEKREDNSLRDIVSCHLIKSRLFHEQGLTIKAAKLAEQTYKESLDLGNNVLSLDSLFIRADILINSGEMTLANNIINQYEEILTSLKEIPETEKNQRTAVLLYLKGRRLDPNSSPTNKNEELALKYYNDSLALAESLGDKISVIANLLRIAGINGFIRSNLDLALEFTERVLILSKEISSKLFMTWGLSQKATFYGIRGEVRQSIPLFEQSLVIAKELNQKGFISVILNNMADTYRMSGDLDRALECSEESLRISSDFHFPIYIIANIHDYLIQILIEKGDLEQAQEKLSQLEQLNNQIENRDINELFLYNKALLLKESSRISNMGKAEEILKKVLESTGSIIETTQRPLLTLCELLLTELQLTGDLEVLEEIDSYIVKLLDVAERSRSFWIWGETYLLQAKLALISLELTDARKLLTQGQHIAEKYGLKLLANKISNEHDKLLKQLSIWEDLKTSDAPLDERIKLAGISDQVENMIRRRVLEFSEDINEQPVFLLIVSEGGKPLFSYLFEEDQSFEDHIFGGFFTAINSFINEKFSEGLDRASFGEHTLLMSNLSPFFICYVFKGQSYSAQKRVGAFIDKIENDKAVWQKFMDFHKLSKEIQIKDVPILHQFITDVFIENGIPLI
ncbi:MAG: tetratricopeptide repeat protein [Promethearchaeota archaeon]|jgi:tetratricopeptide (TPR) repeat protein